MYNTSSRLYCYSVPQIGLVDMLYRKSLRVSSAAKGQLGAGKIVNLQSNDACEWEGRGCRPASPATGCREVRSLLSGVVFSVRWRLLCAAQHSTG
jgi:hypothetical protein